MKNSSKTKNYHHGDLRNALLRVAAELVVTHGVEGFSLREAARRVGVTPTACYRHFADKSALLNAVAVEGFTDLAERMEAQSSRDADLAANATSSISRAKQRFFAVGRAYVNFAVDNPAQFRVMFGPHGAGGSESVRGASKASGKDSYQIFIQALDELVTCGAVEQQARQLAELPAWASIHGLAALLVDGLVSGDTPQALGMMVDNVIQHTLLSMRFTDKKEN